jgi:hypothetical protein
MPVSQMRPGQIMNFGKNFFVAASIGLIFPLAFLASFYVLYTSSDERWYHGNEVNISPEKAIEIAVKQCWPDHSELASTHTSWSTHLDEDMKWIITLGWGGWYRLGLRDSGAIAVVDAKNGAVLHCAIVAI